jgi:opacity protein-like surface antigen
MKRILALCAMAVMALSVFVASSCAQQDKGARPSPPANAQCKLADGKTITIDYSSPRMKGRKIFGELVPYGKVWRAGANEATTFVTTGDTSVGGTTVPAGSYTIFVIPNADKWTLVISKKTGEWGTAYPGESNDLARVDMAVSKTSAPVENFTIDFDQSGGGCTLQMKWENTQASVKIAAK